MRIGLFVHVVKEARPSGVGFHILNLLEQLGRIDRDNEYLLYYQCGLTERADNFRHCPNAPNFRRRPVRFPSAWFDKYPSLWWKRYLPIVIRRDRLDVFHGPSHLVPASDPARNIVTIHDVALFKMDLYSAAMTQALRQWIRSSLDWSGHVIALSENTRNDLIELGVAPEKLRVIYGGGHVVPDAEIRYDRANDVRQRFGLTGPSVLFVGTLHPRKNVPFLLRAFARLKKEANLPHRLILAGKRDAATAEIEKLIAELGVARDVTITGYVEDWEIPLLYKMADLFVLPTLYEGFTLVTLEAMAYGTPVISTDTSSIREGTGDAAILVPVNDVEALATAMRNVLSDGALRADLIARGAEQAKKFTWEQCARETLALYQEVASGARNGHLVDVAS